MLNLLEIIEEGHPLNIRQADPKLVTEGKVDWAPEVLGTSPSLTLWEKKSQEPLPFTKEGDTRRRFTNPYWLLHLLWQSPVVDPWFLMTTPVLISIYQGFQGDRAKEFSLGKTADFGHSTSKS